MQYMFAPGCALVLYKNRLVERLHEYLRGRFGEVDLLLTCCRHTPKVAVGKCVINVCPGCDRRYRQNYETPSTVSLPSGPASKVAGFGFAEIGGVIDG